MNESRDTVCSNTLFPPGTVAADSLSVVKQRAVPAEVSDLEAALRCMNRVRVINYREDEYKITNKIEIAMTCVRQAIYYIRLKSETGGNAKVSESP